MATTLYFVSGTNVAYLANTGQAYTKLNSNVGGYQCVGLRASTTRGTSAVVATVNTVTGPTNGVEFGTYPWLFVSPPLAEAVTVSGSMTFNMWAYESSMSANVAINCRVMKLAASDGTLTEIRKTVRSTELGTAYAVNNWAETPTSTSLAKGDRIVLIPFIDDGGGTMATGYMGGFAYDGPVGVSGDSYVTFTETFTFETTAPSGGTAYMTSAAASGGINPGSNIELDAWTSRGGSATSNSVNTVTGWTNPIVWGVEWYTRPLVATTLSGIAVVNARGLESNAAANAAIRCEIAVVNQDGTTPTVWGSNGYPSEVTAVSEQAYQFWVSGPDLAISNGQRIRIRFVADDALGSTAPVAMTTGYTVNLYSNGPTANASGDTWVQFGFTLSEYSSGSTTYLTPAVTATFTLTNVRQVGKPVSLTATVTPAVGRQVGFIRAVTATLGASVLRGFAKTTSVGVTVTPAVLAGRFLSRAADVAVTVAAAGSRVASRFVTVPVGVTVTSVGARVASLLRTVPVGVTVDPVAARVASRFRAVAVGVTVAPTVVRQVGKSAAVSVSFALSSALGKVFMRAGDVAVALTAVASKRVGKPAAIAVTQAIGVARRVGWTVPLSLPVTLGTARVGSYLRTAAAAVTVAPAVVRRIGKNVAATLTFSMAAIPGKVFKRTGAAVVSVTAAAANGLVLFRTAAVSVTVSPAVRRSVAKTASAGLSLAVAAARQIRLNPALSVTLTTTPRRVVGFVRAASLAVGVGVTKAPGVARLGAVAVTTAVVGVAKYVAGRVTGTSVPVTPAASHSVIYYQPGNAPYRRWFDAALRQLRR